jgi:hypothetical protein
MHVPDEPTEILPEPEFTVVSVEHQAFAAVPTLKFTVRIDEPRVPQVYMIALTVQIQIDPARRKYDEETRPRLIELFGEPHRWAATTHSFVWAVVDVLVPPFSGTGEVIVPVACNYDLEIAATKYFYALSDGEVPLTFLFSGRVYYQGEHGLRLIQVPWSCSAPFRMPVATWKAMIAEHYPSTGWVALHESTLERLVAEKARRGVPTFDALIARMLEESR